MKLNIARTQKTDFAIYILDNINKLNEDNFSKDEIKHIKKLYKDSY